MSAGFRMPGQRDDQRMRRFMSVGDAGIAAPVIGSYPSMVAAAAPTVWWKLDETTGTTAADSGSSGNAGTLTGGATFASTGVSIAAPSGYAGLGTGINLSAASVTDVRKSSATVKVLGNGTNPFTVLVWMAGSAGASQYVFSRVNDAAIIYQFVTDKVEFFSSIFTGSDPRTGSQISLPAADTTTPHLIMYRYDGTNWSGGLDGSIVFNVARSFSIGGSATFYLGSDGSTNVCNSRIWDMQSYTTRAITDAEFANLYAARNNP